MKMIPKLTSRLNAERDRQHVTIHVGAKRVQSDTAVDIV